MQTSPREIRLGHLRAARGRQGLGLREAARLAGIDPSHLWRVEHGQARLSVPRLARLARVLGDHDLARQLEHLGGNGNG
jgi:transcriptional regulator with XRE-family HTH domain